MRVERKQSTTRRVWSGTPALGAWFSSAVATLATQATLASQGSSASMNTPNNVGLNGQPGRNPVCVCIRGLSHSALRLDEQSGASIQGMHRPQGMESLPEDLPRHTFEGCSEVHETAVQWGPSTTRVFVNRVL
jgi:hypothetical protein